MGSHRALGRENERKLLAAIEHSRSPALYPFFVLSLDAGLRPSETRALQHSNLQPSWRDKQIESGESIIGQSKTEAGTARLVPLTRRACVALAAWLKRFPAADGDSYVFPFHRVALFGNLRTPYIYDVDVFWKFRRGPHKSPHNLPFPTQTLIVGAIKNV